MDSMRIASPAKINWFLHVGSRRADGFHELETVFQEIDLVDTITIEPSSAVSLRCSAPGVPLDATNLAWRAWAIASERWGAPAVTITIDKQIPAGGGLGGGSSNAASVLMALVRMFDLPADEAELADAALELGSDVPFFLHGGCAFARGRGEVLSRISVTPRWPLLLILPEVPVSTPEAFLRLATLRKSGATVSGENAGMDAAIEALSSDDPSALDRFRNDLERPAFEIAPRVAAAARAAALAGAPMVRMSGSGSTVWAAFRDVSERERVRRALAADYRVVPAMSAGG